MAKKNDKNNDILISIIVPVYNTSKYLVKCLDSIYAAIDNDCEVIIVNDGSTDDSERIIKDYISNLKNETYKNNTVYIYKENKGLADTKNVGIKKSRGKFISVVDSDDRINKNFYRDAREYLDKNDMVIYDLYTDYEDDPKYNHIIRAAREDCLDSKVSKFVHGAMQGSSCNKIIKKDLYKGHVFPVGKQYEDTAVTPFILSETDKIKYVPYPLYYYLQREKSIVATNTLMSAYYKICENISVVLRDKNLEKYKYVINEFVLDRMLDMLTQDFKENKKSFLKNVQELANNNKQVIDYIVNSNMIDTIENHYSERQKQVVKEILKYLQNSQYSEIKKLLRIRESLNRIRKIWR